MGVNVDEKLVNICKESLSENEPQIIEKQKELYKKWSVDRDSLLESEYKALLRRGRMEAIEQTKEELAREEEKLFFFDNFDKLEMEKDVKVQNWKRTLPARNWSLPGYFRNLGLSVSQVKREKFQELKEEKSREVHQNKFFKKYFFGLIININEYH